MYFILYVLSVIDNCINMCVTLTRHLICYNSFKVNMDPPMSKPIQCGICQKPFKAQFSRVQHVKARHPSNSFRDVDMRPSVPVPEPSTSISDTYLLRPVRVAAAENNAPAGRPSVPVPEPSTSVSNTSLLRPVRVAAVENCSTVIRNQCSTC